MDFLGRIRKLDSSLQRGLDNSFARVFGGKVVPNELEECLKQEIEDFLMQDANGDYLAPNDFCIGVSPSDFQNLAANEPKLPELLADRMTRYCRNNGWNTSGPVAVQLHDVESLHTGQLKTASQFSEAPSASSYEGDVIAGDASAASNSDGANTGSNSGSLSSNNQTKSGNSAVHSLVDAPAPGAPEQAATSAAYHAEPGATAYGKSPEQSTPAKQIPSNPSALVAANVEKQATDGYSDGSDSEQFPTASRPAIVEAETKQPISQTVTLFLLDGSNRTFEVRPGSNIIGRGTASDFRLPDTGVSRQHAEITWDGTDAVLVDLHSTNGTIVNEEPIENWLLANGDVISMGHSVMKVEIR